MFTWSFVVVVSRIPVAMAPLAFVFLARESSGGYSAGAVMAAAYTAAEAAGAPVLGARLRTRPFRREIAGGLLVSSAAFAAIAVLPGLSLAVSAGLAAVAGAGSAAAPGALRAMVADLVRERDLNSALSVESSLNMAVWAASPALVATAALHYSATLPFFAATASALTGAACVFLLPEKSGSPAAPGTSRDAARQLAAAWPIYLTSVAVMYLLATVELSLPALLEQRGHPVVYSGPMLTCFALASIAGGILYGLRAWPGSPERQSIVLSLRNALTADLHPVGYSVLYAGSGIGYGVSAAVTGLLLAHVEPSSGVLSAAACTFVLTLVTLLRRRKTGSHGPPREQRFRSRDSGSVPR